MVTDIGHTMCGCFRDSGGTGVAKVCQEVVSPRADLFIHTSCRHVKSLHISKLVNSVSSSTSAAN